MKPQRLAINQELTMPLVGIHENPVSRLKYFSRSVQMKGQVCKMLVLLGLSTIKLHSLGVVGIKMLQNEGLEGQRSSHWEGDGCTPHIGIISTYGSHHSMIFHGFSQPTILNFTKRRVWNARAMICLPGLMAKELSEGLASDPRMSCTRRASSGTMKSRKLAPFKVAPGPLLLKETPPKKRKECPTAQTATLCVLGLLA